jgi:uncharacterized protein (DUF433 family)
MSTTTHLEYPLALKEHAKAVLESLTPEPPPLRLDADCVLRVGPTRIPLDRVIYAFNTGCTAEAILDDFPTLKLTDIYAVITYYLWHREVVDAYLRAREEHAEEIRREHEARWPKEGIKERLLARRAERG